MPRSGAGGQCGERGHDGAGAGPPRRRGHEPVRQQLVIIGVTLSGVNGHIILVILWPGVIQN